MGYVLETVGGRFVVLRGGAVVASCTSEEAGRAALRLLTS